MPSSNENPRACSGSIKVIDAFMFFNELDVLDIRLHELDPVVDYFVINEALERHGSTMPKAALLKDNWRVIRPFEHKVKYTLLPMLKPAFVNQDTATLREHYQRASLLDAVRKFASPADALIVSDCDEVPRAAAVRAALPGLSEGVYHFNQDFFYYNVNWFLYDDWNPALIGLVGQLTAEIVERERRIESPTRVLHNGGWHFSYFGGATSIMEKVASVYDSEEPEYKDVLRRGSSALAADIKAGRNLYRGRTQLKWRETKDLRLPDYLLKNIQRFKHLTAEG